ncbi:putative carbohydrate sulfotransferase 8-like [Penaeus vannamei]|uniref:Carbohydrate sulfotransferase n=1 Tax=Penaeus vannamei TaxID=6689 RepID=A0A3R7MPP6_PENVA|nr:carbohydrate sulfotransferase 12-like [Penaeus vannamei]ROT82612.1 putative carbohydrate sulfotransferase 8-like [Penaeus vannamei]
MHVVEGHKDPSSVLDRRRSNMLAKCRGLDTSYPATWLTNVTRGLSVCVPPKAGHTSWGRVKRELSQVGPIDGSTKILSVRHPLVRLTSAYRDKYLDGKPLHRTPEPKKTWIWWRRYWFPALLSRGDIPPPRWMTLEVRSTQTLPDPCQRVAKENMYVYLKARELEKPWHQSRFQNTTFSFQDFLNHVLWTARLRQLDYHWAPQTCLCNPCKVRYDYVLHLENIGHELDHVLRDLGIAQEIPVPRVHVTKDDDRMSDAGYYKDVPQEIMRQIYSLFRYDFDVLNYSRSLGDLV